MKRVDLIIIFKYVLNKILLFHCRKFVDYVSWRGCTSLAEQLAAAYQRQGGQASSRTKQVPFLYEDSLIDLSPSHVNTTSHMTPA